MTPTRHWSTTVGAARTGYQSFLANVPKLLAILWIMVIALSASGCKQSTQSTVGTGQVMTQPDTIALTGTGHTLEVSENEEWVVCRILDEEGRAIGAWTFADQQKPWAYFVEGPVDGEFRVWLSGTFGGLHRVGCAIVGQDGASHEAVQPENALYRTMPEDFAGAIQ